MKHRRLKRIGCLLLVLLLTLGLLPTAAAAGTGIPASTMEIKDAGAADFFFEDFGDTEEEAVDSTIWHHQAGSTSAVMLRSKDPESTDAQNGKGYCFYTNGTQSSFIEHTFDVLIRGKVTVDFYDDGENVSNRMAQVNLTGVANAQNSDKPFTIGLGINQNTKTSVSSNVNYCARIADDGRYIDTGVAREKGWHTFTLECTAEGTEMWIDEQKIDTSTIPEKDIVTAFQNIQLGDKWCKGGENWYDNVRVENITVVDLEAEEAAKKDASLKSILVDGISLPDFRPDVESYTWQVLAGTTEFPRVTAEVNAAGALAAVTQASAENGGTASILVTSKDGSATKTYTVAFKETEKLDDSWYETFDNADALNNWETLDSRGTYTEVSAAQDHTENGGFAFVTRGTATAKSWIFKKFDQPVYGQVTVWFYDTMGETGAEKYQQVNIWAPFEDVSNQPTIIGLGVKGGGATYVIRDKNGTYPNTGVARTNGWHEFTFDCTSGTKTVFYLDKQKVYETGDVTSIGALQMGDIWSTSGATAYYDDVSITNISPAVSGVALNYESCELPCGETVQLKATVFPTGADSSVLWTSSNDAIASVDENGLVTAGTVMGKASITATTVKGTLTAACEVTVTMGTEQDATLKNIWVDGTALRQFSPDELEYDYYAVGGKVPQVTAEAAQDGAKVEVTDATEVPGDAKIVVTAQDGVRQAVYTLHFKTIENVFFDDFSYEDVTDLEQNGNWAVQDGTGMRPGNRTWYWSRDNVTLVADQEDTGNTFVRLKAKTDGTGGENTTQAQIRYYEEKFGAGTYVARVWLYDNVMEADGEKGTGAWNAKDLGLSTFFTINRIEAPSWAPYHESDFEYLFNGGWGGKPQTMWFTTWNSYALSTSTEGQTNQVSSSNNECKSLDGKWTILTIRVDEDGKTTYYINGVQKASHADKASPAGPQSIAFNLWFINSQQDSTLGARTYWEDIDWVYYTPDTAASTEEVEEIVAGLKAADISLFDEIASPDVTLKSVSVGGEALSDFDSGKTEYAVTLPAGTTEAPAVTAEANGQWAIVDITPAETLPGATTIFVQSSDLSATKTYHISFTVAGDDTVAPPLSTVASGSSAKWRDVQLFHTDDRAEIYYTLDGTVPTTASARYEKDQIIRVEKSTELKAIAVIDGKTSAVADYLYTIIPITPQVVMHPDVSLKTGTYEGTQYLELTMPESKQRFYEVPGRTDNYKIYYTTDGTLPTVNRYSPNPGTKEYTGPIEIKETTTINFIAVLPGVCESYEATETLRNQYSRVTITIIPVETEEHEHQWSEIWNFNGDEHWHECLADGCDVTDNSQKNGYGLHTAGEWIIDTEATETADGLRHKECTACGYEMEREIIPATGIEEEHEHRWSEAWSFNGDEHWHECLVDGCDVTDNSQKNGYGLHTAGEWIVDTEATDMADGLRHKECTGCGYVMEREVIPATGTDLGWTSGGYLYWFMLYGEQNPFTDVGNNAYYKDAVVWALEKDITTGTSQTTFAPDAACTRAQAVTFLWRAAGSPTPRNQKMPFSDVAASAYYYDAVLWAVEQGITNGTSETTFSPDAECTRAQIVTFLWRAEGMPASGAANPFSDVGPDAYYAKAVLWAVERGITTGTSYTAFSPDETCTRAQIVTFLYRCFHG